ncbi:hypothetical protein BU15DRAFT_60195 [Melanogaster broomeanus]|nr:hypothetical protein BU15DRAFT_60195 [Melanogaster broomeanus]
MYQEFREMIALGLTTTIHISVKPLISVTCKGFESEAPKDATRPGTEGTAKGANYQRAEGTQYLWVISMRYIPWPTPTYIDGYTNPSADPIPTGHHFLSPPNTYGVHPLAPYIDGSTAPQPAQYLWGTALGRSIPMGTALGPPNTYGSSIPWPIQYLWVTHTSAHPVSMGYITGPTQYRWAIHSLAHQPYHWGTSLG